MAPKAKAKAKGMAKAKAMVRPRAMAKARGRIRGGGLRRPARADERTSQEKWDAGEELHAHAVPIEFVGSGTRVVVTQAKYYHKACQVAGEVDSLSLRGTEVILALRLSGTDEENILKLHTAEPQKIFRVHKCGTGCAQEETADDLLHCMKMRKMRARDQEDGWVFNLEKAVPLEGEDDLAKLRERVDRLPPVAPGGGRAGGDQEKPEKKSKKKEKKKKKRKEARKKEDSVLGSSSNSREQGLLDGSRATAASKKDPQVIFEGTGLDPKERVRKKVIRKARRHLKRKGTKDDSTDSEGSSDSGSLSEMEGEDESVFQQSSKVRLVASGFPGALGCQALTQMRSTLLSEIGSDDRPGILKGCAVAYFRQCLQRKSTGAMQRELHTIAAAVDMMVAGRVAGAVDLLLQRLKSCESTLHGTHWSVSQRQEVLPQDGNTLTPLPEMEGARKDVYAETRLRWMAAQPDGRGASSQGKGAAKGKGEWPEDGKRGFGKDRKGGKGKSPKGDNTKKGKEETTPKA